MSGMNVKPATDHVRYDPQLCGACGGAPLYRLAAFNIATGRVTATSLCAACMKKSEPVLEALKAAAERRNA